MFEVKKCPSGSGQKSTTKGITAKFLLFLSGDSFESLIFSLQLLLAVALDRMSVYFTRN